MATISKLVPGQILYEVRSVRMGNTTLRRRACYEVKIKEISEDGSKVMASWNGNHPRQYSEREINKLRTKKPKPKREICGMPSY